MSAQVPLVRAAENRRNEITRAFAVLRIVRKICIVKNTFFHGFLGVLVEL